MVSSGWLRTAFYRLGPLNLGDAGANILPRQPASQGSNLHASAPCWVFCFKSRLSGDLNASAEKSTHRYGAAVWCVDSFWCADDRVYDNWLNVEQFPL
ncbi:hypothetical protein B7R56_18665 [Pseudomonas savastanoi pv. retacarpa]|uniref:Uncharacterized protein n=1 Tax=Pseudomonas savastanoi pv. nerii TaxID=360921 RepID=A0AB73S024_PSESS|nr:hypothetical protein BKM19_027935 [Pseudomonas amygdali pv. morsprunorum]KAA3541510.1 hypothetical protein DXU85_18550 [Pseudomonas savastanoi]OSR26921.1 hypothetical protein B7R56_18665 [Pseudomonas savastanoi pv. retacarpa]PAB28824.1 hypothetical protein CC205_20670 [Pseudomonas savastanoi pv. nerii]QDW02863.1 hypothetical protein FFH21_026040 [Pseudomonas sp. KBS0707]QED86967.1 hypothetical protein PSYTB_26680 [Pseudomonas amygdali pv. tabaci str. ATCC 11528]TSC35446.1 hypothetical prot